MIPSKLVPHDYQEAAIRRALAEPTHGVLIGSGLGSGKTLVATEIALRLNLPRVLIVAPRNTLKQWAERFAAQSDGKVTVRRLDSTAKGKAAFEDFLAGEPGYYMSNTQWLTRQDYEYEPAVDEQGDPIWRVKKSTGELLLDKDENPIQETHRIHVGKYVNMRPLNVTIFDECFAAGKLVDTPSGPRPIETLRVGDEVYGYDHATNTVQVTTVLATMERENSALMKNGATPNHPYYVAGDGYRPIADITEEDEVLERFGSTVRRVRSAAIYRPSSAWRPVLLAALRRGAYGARAQEASREGVRMVRRAVRAVPRGRRDSVLFSSVQQSGAQRIVAGRVAGGTAEEGRARRAIAGKRVVGFQQAHEGEQPLADARRHREGAGYEAGEGDYLHTSHGRERQGVARGGAPSVSARRRLAALVRGGYRTWIEGSWLAHELQDRRSSSLFARRDRVRRAESQLAVSEGARRAEGLVSGPSRLDDLAILEPRDSERYRRVSSANRVGSPVCVYNIETGTSNYFVDGILVHNCHAIQNRNSITKRTFFTIPTDWRIGMSATWNGNRIEGGWSVSRWTYPGKNEQGEYIVDRSFHRWVDQYCITEDVYVPGKEKPVSQVVAEKVPGAFAASLPCYIRDLPFDEAPAPIGVYVDITPAQRAQYTQLEEEMVAWARTHMGTEEPIVADLPIVKRQRLRTATLGELGIGPDGEITFADDCASAKLVALRGILDKLDADAGEKVPAVIFTDSRRFARITYRRMVAAGYKAVEWTGDATEKQREEMKRAFMAGEVDYVVATIPALSEGVDGLQLRCSTVIWLSYSEDQLKNQQSAARIWRPGVDVDRFKQIAILAKDTLDDSTYVRLAQTRERTMAMMKAG